MKKLLFTSLIITCALTISVMYSCKKNDTPATTNPATPDQTVSNNNTFADDQNMYSAESNQSDGDITSDMAANDSSYARVAHTAHTTSLPTLVCGATLTLNNDTLVYTFDGTTPCIGGSRTRSGVILVSISNGPLKSANAMLKVKF